MKLGPYLTSYTKKMGNRHKHKSRIIKVLGKKKTWINPHDPGWGNDSLDRIPKEQVIKENIDNLGSIHYQESERIAQGLGENMCRYLVRSLYLQKPKNFYNSMLLFSCSVTSDSLQPMDGSTSDFPVLHHLLQSCPTLYNPMKCSPPGSSVCGILHARILEWVAILFSRGSSQPGDQTQVSWIAGRFFTVWATGKPPITQ